MLPVQPAVKQLELLKFTDAMRGSTECRGQTHFKYGIRMGALYDLAQEQTNIPITGVGFKWERDDTFGLLSGLANAVGFGKEGHRVVMTVNHTVQCCFGGPDRLGPEFKSMGYERVEIKWGEEKALAFR